MVVVAGSAARAGLRTQAGPRARAVDASATAWARAVDASATAPRAVAEPYGRSATLADDDDRDGPGPRPCPRCRPPPADLQRDPAVGRAAPRQRPRRDPQLRPAPGRVRHDLLHRRLPRADEPPRPGRAAGADARDGGRAGRPGPRPGPLHPLRAEPPPRAHRARLAADDGHAGELARADAHLQGEAREPARRHQPRPAHVPGAAGRGHRHLQGVAGPGRQGPGRPPGALARDRPALQLDLRRDLPRAAGRPHRGSRGARHGRRPEDEQVAEQHHRDPGLARGHPAPGHEHGHRHAAHPADRPGAARRSATSASCTASSAATTRRSGTASGPRGPAASTRRSCSRSGSSPTTPRPASATRS